ncbi:PBP1A family penicillin-binding protein [Virgibacillus ihumii]|uniref:PBP1A family penicillin-binding protein n=1 Tax=Virgibacillus ihumii TaxID=2686091 RepID=UPI00157BEC28|nr:PBP1A family penicillin-binding protein [Virgibacillus ihumii]
MSGDYRSRMERRKGVSNPERNKRKAVLFKKVILYCLVVMVLTILAGSIWIFSIIRNAPELSPGKLQTPFSSQIFDKDGELVTTLFKEQNRIKVDIQKVPDKMKRAVTSVEDRRYYQHNGIDIRRIAGALIANIQEGWGSEGGSTITQQVVKRTVLSPEKTLTRKIKEAYLAVQLEQKYSKQQILQMYLNNIYYGNGAYGIATASKTYFGIKDLSQLNVSQMALLAGLPNAPSYYDPFEYPERAADRRSDVLHAMVVTGAITKEQAEKAESVPVKQLVMKQKKVNRDQDQPYKAFVDQVYHELVVERKIVSDEQFYQGGLKIYTTLDSDVQKKVYRLLKSDEINYPDKQFEAGIALTDTKTGAIRAVGGGRDFLSIGDTNYGTQEKNPPGSTFKPIIDYGPAIEYLNWSTAHRLVDEPYAYSDGTPIHEWDGEYWGEMTIRQALAWSRNIPALKTFQAVGTEKAAAFAGKLGIKLEKPVFESAAIGGLSSGVTPLQLAGAYAAFGNGGIYHKPYTVTKIVFQNGNEKKMDLDSAPAMHDYTAYMITDMLKTVINSGTGTAAAIPGVPVAGKTGSTNIPEHLREKYNIGDGLLDSWFVGYTTQYSAAIWTGYPKFEDGDSIHYIRYNGSEDIAKEIFQKLMGSLSNPNTPDFERPDSVVVSGDALYVQEAKQVSSRSANQREEEPEREGTVQEQSDLSAENKREDASEQDPTDDSVIREKKEQSEDKKSEVENKHSEDRKNQLGGEHPTDQEDSNNKDQGANQEQNDEQNNDHQQDENKKEEDPPKPDDESEQEDSSDSEEKTEGHDSSHDDDIPGETGENNEHNNEENKQGNGKKERDGKET